MANILDQVRDFLRAPNFDEALRELAPNPAQPPLRTSYVFDSHIQEASALNRGYKNLVPQSQSMAWDENTSHGIGDSARNWQGLTTRNRKEILLAMYIANPWVSICADVIAKRITSGGISFEPLVDNPDKSQLKTLEDLLLRVNDEWDFLQYVRASIIDECIFGETYTEIVWQAKTPYMLYKVDCITMGYELDRWGRVQRYYQQMDLSSKCEYLDPQNIIRWWFPHPRAAMDPLSPMELVTDAINLDKKMVNWVTTFFQKGAKFPYTIEFPGDEAEAERFIVWFDNNVTGEKNAHRPLTTWGGAKVTPVGKGSMDIDFPGGRDRNRTEVLGVYHVPPAVAGIIESGNIGGGTGEDQEKSFQYNTCDPIRHTFFEKFNDRIVKKGLGITDWRVSTRYADYRNDENVAKVQDMHVRNGTLLIDEARQENGKKPYPNGAGAVPVIITTKEIVPVPRLKDLEEEARTTAQQAMDAADLNNELLKTKVEQAKNPPPPPPQVQPGGGNHAVQLPQTAQGDGAGATPTQKAAKGPSSAQASAKEQVEEDSHHTGMMLAFMLDPETAQKLAIPGGEPAGDLHVTLAYLGDMADDRASDKRYPDRDPLYITRILTSLSLDTAPLSGVVGGVGRFFPAETETTPVIALVDVPGLSEFRAKLVQALDSAGYFMADNHGYTPHITLAYIDASAPMPVESVPSLPLTFDAVCLKIGDEQTVFKLLGDAAQAQQESSDALPPQHVDFVPDDVDKRLQQIRALGTERITWYTHPYCCDLCAPNNGVTRNVGEAFPNGARLPRCHPNCKCIVYPEGATPEQIRQAARDSLGDQV